MRGKSNKHTRLSYRVLRAQKSYIIFERRGVGCVQRIWSGETFGLGADYDRENGEPLSPLYGRGVLHSMQWLGE